MTGLTLRPATASPLAGHRARWTVALLVVGVWGVNFVIAKHALDQFDIGAFNVLRFSAMTALGWIVVLATSRAVPVPPADRWPLVLVATVGFAGYVYGFSVGLAYTSAFSASLLLALVPLWVVVLTALRTRRRPEPLAIAGLGLAALGVGVFVAARTSVELGRGDVIAVVVAGFYAAYLLLNAPLTRRYPAITLTTYALTIAAVPVCVLNLPGLLGQDWSRVTALGWLSLAWTIVAPVFGAWSVWNWVLKELTTAEVAPLLFLVPIISGLTAWLLLGEAIAAGQIGGTAIVVVALWVNHRSTFR